MSNKNMSPAMQRKAQQEAAAKAAELAKQADKDTEESIQQQQQESTGQEQQEETPEVIGQQDGASQEQGVSEESAQEQGTSQETTEESQEGADEQGAGGEQDQEQTDLEKETVKVDFSTPLPEQGKMPEVIKPAVGVVDTKQGPLVAPKVKDLFTVRMGDLLDQFEAITSEGRAFDAAAFGGIHRKLEIFLFQALERATGEDFINTFDLFRDRIKANAGGAYTPKRYLRGAQGQSQAYATLFNVIGDLGVAANRANLTKIDFVKALGTKVGGEKIADYINHI